MIDGKTPCACGHDWSLHDARGCMAFLGGFAVTANQKRYCGCAKPTRTRFALPYQGGSLREDVVAIVRVRQRSGTAIGVCEFPPALELGASAEQVLDRVKARLRDAVPGPADGSPQWLLVVRDDTADMRVEALR